MTNPEGVEPGSGKCGCGFLLGGSLPWRNPTIRGCRQPGTLGTPGTDEAQRTRRLTISIPRDDNRGKRYTSRHEHRQQHPTVNPFRVENHWIANHGLRPWLWKVNPSGVGRGRFPVPSLSPIAHELHTIPCHPRHPRDTLPSPLQTSKRLNLK